MLSKTDTLSPTTFKAPQISVVFMGTPEFAETALAALIQASYHLVGVVTQPDRKTGRKQELTASPVKVRALRHGLPVYQPEKLNAEAIQTIRAWKPDILVVAAYGKLLPPDVLALPGFGSVNIHASLLPRWRGASPVANALMAGDTETGVTLMEIDPGMDTGNVIAFAQTPIGPDERGAELLARLATLGADLLVRTLPLWITRTLTATPQATDGVTLCQLIDREDGRIFWSAEASEIYNHYRGLHPWPGIFSFWRRGADDVLRIKFHAITLQKTAPALSQPIGTVLEIGEEIGIVTGSGVIFLQTLQLEGKEVMSIKDFVKGYPDFIQSVLI